MIKFHVRKGQQTDYISHPPSRDSELGVACRYLSICVFIFRLWQQLLESFLARRVVALPGGDFGDER